MEIIKIARKALKVDKKDMKYRKGEDNFTKRISGITFMVLIILAIGCFTAGCQPTPDTAPVVNKAEGLPQDKLKSEISNTEATDHWTQTIQKLDGKFVIDANADVYIPEYSAIPVVLLEKSQLTQEKVNQLVDYFSGGKKLYIPEDMTKADLEQQLVQARRGELIDGEYVVTEYSQNLAKELEEKIRNAPESYERSYTDAAFTYRRDPQNGNQPVLEDGEDYLNLKVEDGDGKDAWINASRSGYFGYYKYGYAETESDFSDPNRLKAMLAGGEGGSRAAIASVGGEGESLTEEETKKLENLKKLMSEVQLTPEEAKAKGQKVLDDLGFKEFKAFILTGCERALIDSSIGDVSEKVGGYELEYTRSLGGLPGYRLRSGRILQGDEKDDVLRYVPPFFVESIIITITGDGSIGSFEWMDQANVVETISEDVQLMPFSEIAEHAANQLYYNDSFLLTAEGKVLENVRVRAEVTNAELVSAYINAKDQPQKAWMIPAWHFTANVYQTVDGKEFLYQHEDILLSALDGGVIEVVQPTN